MVSPNGGEVVPAGSVLNALWRSNLFVSGSAVRLELWDGAGKVADLGDAWDPTGEALSQVRLPAVPDASDYRLRAVSLWDAQFSDLSDAPFTISGAAVNAAAPGGWAVYR